MEISLHIYNQLVIEISLYMRHTVSSYSAQNLTQVARWKLKLGNRMGQATTINTTTTTRTIVAQLCVSCYWQRGSGNVAFIIAWGAHLTLPVIVVVGLLDTVVFSLKYKEIYSERWNKNDRGRRRLNNAISQHSSKLIVRYTQNTRNPHTVLYLLSHHFQAGHIVVGPLDDTWHGAAQAY